MFLKLKLYFLSIIIFSLSNGLYADEIVSPFNEKVLSSDSLQSTYSFLAWGHWYGSQLNWRSVLPSSTVISNIDRINAQKPAFIMAMGDIYRHTDSITFSHFKTSIVDKFSIPLFNAVGNHEMEDRSFYESHFGKTIYSFQLKTELYIVLDGEIAICDLEGEQLSWLKNKLDSANNNPVVKNVFIFSHKLIWITLEEKFLEVFKDIHSDYECYDDKTFKDEIYPLLINLSDKKAVYWLSGDYGFTLFYHKVKDHDIHFLSCGINDSEDDAYLKVNISEKGRASIQAHSFTGKKLQSLENYTIDYWREHIPHINALGKAELMFTNKYFWCGLAISLVLLLIGITFLRFFK